MKAFISSRIHNKYLEKISEDFSVDYYDWTNGGLLPQPEFFSRMKDAHLVITESDEITAEMIENSPNLFAIVDFRGTVINIDIEAATKNGVVIINAPGRNADAVADLTVTFMVLLARNVIPAAEALSEGLWEKNGRRWAYVNFQGYDLPGKTVGLMGLGHIGRLVAKRLSGYDVDLIGYDPYVNQETARELNVTLMDRDQVLSESDFLSLHIPLNEKTEGMIGEADLKKMKKSAYLINTARAGVVEESALIRCVEENWIAGVALDVFHNEPIDADYPLLNRPNVICTPHIGGASHDVVDHMTAIGLNGFFDYMKGVDPPNIINQEAINLSREKMFISNS